MPAAGPLFPGASFSYLISYTESPSSRQAKQKTSRMRDALFFSDKGNYFMKTDASFFAN